MDYRHLNDVTVKDAYPLPNIVTVWTPLVVQGYLTLDLQSGYWQIEVGKEDRPKTEVITCHRL